MITYNYVDAEAKIPINMLNVFLIMLVYIYVNIQFKNMVM